MMTAMPALVAVKVLRFPALVAVKVLRFYGECVSPGVNPDLLILQLLLVFGALDGVNFYFVLVPRGDVYCAVYVLKLNAAIGIQRISLVKLFCNNRIV